MEDPHPNIFGNLRRFNSQVRPRLLLLLLLFFSFSCSEPSQKPAVPAEAPESDSPAHPPEDTIPQLPTGVPIPAKGRWVPSDSIAPYVTVPLTGSPIVLPAHPDVHPAGKPEVVNIPENLTVITPGKDSVPLPKTVQIEGKVVPAMQPRPAPAPSLRFKDAATANFQYFNIDLGQWSNRIGTICQDSRGRLWFGTPAGAICYDGKNMIQYTEKEGLSNNSISAIIEDSKGRMWFGTKNGGLTCYDGNNFIHFTEKEGLSSNQVLSIVEDSQGNLWVGTNKGACRFDGEQLTHFTKKEGLTDDAVSFIREDSRGNLWFGTARGGACRYDGERFTHFTEKEGLSSNLVYCITEDSRGNIWFGTYGGANRYDGATFTTFTEREGLIGRLVDRILEDNNGNIWFVNKDSGAVSKSAVTRFDGKNFTHFTEEEGLSHNRVWGIALDNSGSIWFGAAEGVSRYSQNSFVNFTEQNGLNHEQMLYTILEDRQGDLWLGTWTGGLIRYDGFNFTYFNKDTYILNQSLFDNDGNLWFENGGRGVTRFDGQNFTHFKESENHISLGPPLLADSLNGLWFATGDGMLHRGETGDTVFHEKEGLQSAMYASMIKDRHGDYWLGTEGWGAVKYDGVSFTRYTEKEGLANDVISAMLEDSRGNLWFATDGGISIYDGQQFTNYTEKEGLGNDRAFSLKEDKSGRIWVSRYGGISLFVPDSLAAVQQATPEAARAGGYRIINFGQMDGLKGRQYQNVCLDQKNRIWWGSEAGMTMLDLHHFKLPAKPPVIQLGHVEIRQQFIDFRNLKDTAYQNTLPFGKDLSRRIGSVVPFFNYPAKLSLPHSLNHLTFHFSAIEWAAPHQVRYSYKIDGVDNDWSQPQPEPVADYRNLPHGTHTLKVRAIGAAQTWSEPFEYRFTILPPLHKTWYAWLFYAFAMGGVLFGIRRYELRRHLANAEARRLQELDTIKNQLYTNITYEFRTPLTVILGMAEQVKNDPANWFNEGLKLIRRNGQQLLGLVNQLLDLARIESGHMPLHLVQANIVSFLRYLSESFHSLAESKDIRLHFLSEVKELQMDYDPEKLKNIVSNLLSNAIKFTPAGGDIYLGIKTEGPDKLMFSVKDTGVGISEKDLPHIFDRFYQVDASHTRRGEGTGIGLALVRELVKLMGGSIAVESKVGEGSVFTVVLPVTKTAEMASPGHFESTPPPLAAELILKKENLETDALQRTDRPIVLLVEDNPDVITYLASFLAAAYEVETAANGKIGIEKAIELVPDLVVSDVMMPEKDGFEVCETLKTDERTSHIPIILLTAMSDHGSKIQGLSHGADAYLAKPFSKEELLVRIEKLIELRKQLQGRFKKTHQLLKVMEAPTPGPEEVFLQKLIGIVEAHLADEHFGIPELCRKSLMSRSQLFRKLKALTGKPATRFIRSIRMEKAKLLLETTDMPIGEIGAAIGFNDPAYFSRVFHQEFGVPPSEVRR